MKRSTAAASSSSMVMVTRCIVFLPCGGTNLPQPDYLLRLTPVEIAAYSSFDGSPLGIKRERSAGDFFRPKLRLPPQL
jgi:hypothetical protein